MGTKDKKKSKKKSKKGKKPKIPWYLQEELMREKEAKERAEREAEAEKLRIAEEEQRWNAMTMEEREKEEVKRAAKAKQAEWKVFYEKQAEEEERQKRIEEERMLITERRQKEREQRQKQLAEGIQEDYGNILIQRCKTCQQKCYKHEQVVVGNHVFHKIGCFKCFFCNMPLKLWNYKLLEGRYYCTPHYEQFHVKITNRIQHEIKAKALLIEKLKEEERRLEEEKRLREEQAAKSESEEAARLQKIRDEELAQKRAELAKQAEEMRKMIECQEKGIEYVPTDQSSARAKAGAEDSDSDSEGDSDDDDSDSDSDDEDHKKRDPDVEALVKAAREGNQTTIQSLLDKGVSIDSASEEGQTALIAAALAGSLTTVEFLLSLGADVTKKPKGSTALHLVCNSELQADKQLVIRENDIVKLLAEHPKTEINDTDMNLNTPLILASSKGKVEVVRSLVRAKAQVRPRNNLGATCLHAAADSGQVEVAKQLMNVEQMDVDMQDEQGYTPLHLAVMGNHVAMTRLLLALGANIHIGEKAHNRSPLAEAQIKSSEMKKLFDLFAHKKEAPAGAAIKLDLADSGNRDKSPKKSRFGVLFRSGGKGKEDKPKKEPTSPTQKSPRSPRRREGSKDEEASAFPGIPLRAAMPPVVGHSSPPQKKGNEEDEQLQKKKDEDAQKKKDEEDKKKKEEEAAERKAEKRRKKEEQKKLDEQKRLEDEVKMAEEQKKLAEERQKEDERRKEEDKKRKEEEYKKAQQVLGAIKTKDAPAFLQAANPVEEKKEVKVGKIKPINFSGEIEPISTTKSPVQTPKKIQPPSFLNNSDELSTAQDPPKEGRAVGRIKTPAFLTGTSPTEEKTEKDAPPQRVGKLKAPSFLNASEQEQKTDTPNRPVAGVGKIKKPAFLEQTEPESSAKKKPSAVKPGKLKRPAFLEAAEKAAKEEEEEEEEEEEDGYEYEYEYEYVEE